MNTPNIKTPKIWVNAEFQRLLWLNLSWGMIAGVAIIYALFAFAKGEGISTHESKGDALVVVLDGKGRLTIDGKDYELAKGDSILANTIYILLLTFRLWRNAFTAHRYGQRILEHRVKSIPFAIHHHLSRNANLRFCNRTAFFIEEYQFL